MKMTPPPWDRSRRRNMESRLRKRIKVALEGIVEIDKYFKHSFALANGSRFEAEVRDISEDGASIVSEYYLPKELTVGLTVKSSPFGLRQALTVIGEVCYCNNLDLHRYQCGIKFLSLRMRYRKAINKFASYYSRA